MLLPYIPGLRGARSALLLHALLASSCSSPASSSPSSTSSSPLTPPPAYSVGGGFANAGAAVELELVAEYKVN